MIGRCENPAFKGYRYWGGRGISVCEEWHDFKKFAVYILSTLGERPELHTLDRIDNDGNYEPGNVRWASPVEQARNKRRIGGWKCPPGCTCRKHRPAISVVGGARGVGE